MDRFMTLLCVAAITAFGQTRPPITNPIEAHEINGLFLSHLETQARHVQAPPKLGSKAAPNYPAGRPTTGGPLTNEELLAIRPLLATARIAIQAADASIAAEKILPNGKVPPGQSAKLDRLHAERKAAIEEAMRQVQLALAPASRAKLLDHIDNEFYKGVPRVTNVPGK